MLTRQLLQVNDLHDVSGSEQSQDQRAIMSQRQGTILKKCTCASQDRCTRKLVFVGPKGVPLRRPGFRPIWNNWEY